MGTRGITRVISGGKTVVSQYGQWDHYPSGQGVIALTILRHPEVIPGLREHVSNLSEASEDSLKAAWLDAGADPDSSWVTMDVSDRFEKAHPELSRNTGAKILAYVAAGEAPAVVLEPDPPADDIWIEGIIEVNLDADTFSWIYPGYKTFTYPLSNLPDNDTFLSETEGDEDE